MLLFALGVEKKTIVRDFIKTNDYVMEQVDQLTAQIEKQTGDKPLARCVRVLFTVSESSILRAFSVMERSFGSIDDYLRVRIGVNSEKRDRLRKKFLTD